MTSSVGSRKLRSYLDKDKTKMHTDLDKNPISLLPKDIIWLGNKMYVTSLVYANSN